jgi:putative DNA primase/helicase
MMDRRSSAANRRFARALPIKGTAGEAYFLSRGISHDTIQVVGHALRFAPQCPTRLQDGSVGRFDAVIAQMRDVVSDAPRAIHRTFLKDGRKAELPGGAKRMLGPVAGCAIKLCRDDDVIEGLGIAEGIETALSVLQTGWRPIWALGSAGSIETFPLLGGIEALTIWADADINQAGLWEARICQARWAEAGRECRILLPPCEGTDWNDVIGAAA